MKACSPKVINKRYCSVTNLPTLFKETDKSPTLLDVKLTYGHDYLYQYLTIWIIEIIEVGGIENNISEDRLTQAIEISFRDYLNVITLADMKLFFDYAINGKLVDNGNNTGYFIKMNARTLSIWIKKYVSMRIEYAQEESINEASNYKESSIRDFGIKSIKDVNR